MIDGEASDRLLAGRYRLDERIAAGPLGDLWRAHDQRADWPVAVKVVDAGLDAVTRGRLLRRARALAEVPHPNVVTVLEVGERYVVMEYLPGESLADVERPLPVEEVRLILLQLIAGLDAAHRGGIAHGALRPADARRAGSGVLKITGFGVAGDGLPAPEALAVPESPYLAPEQRTGETGRAADRYALGVIGYELLTGRLPGGDPEEPAAAPRELRQVLLGWLAAEPEARPGLETARQALTRTPGETTALSWTDRPQEPAPPVEDAAPGTAVMAADPLDRPSRRMLVQLAVALTLIAAVAAALALWPRGERETDGAAVSVETTAPETVVVEPVRPTAPIEDPVQTFPSPLPLSEGTPPGGWRVFVGRLHEAVTVHERLGEIDPQVAAETHRGLDKALDRIRSGRTADGLEELEETAHDLAEARDRGELPPDGALADLLERFGLW